uniref:Uncharacterized protein n=1 Tax=Glossina brevipalpis TaxID=37001 RepID=A0A1A9WJ44_9MUSC
MQLNRKPEINTKQKTVLKLNSLKALVQIELFSLTLKSVTFGYIMCLYLYLDVDIYGTSINTWNHHRSRYSSLCNAIANDRHNKNKKKDDSEDKVDV